MLYKGRVELWDGKCVILIQGVPLRFIGNTLLETTAKARVMLHAKTLELNTMGYFFFK
jgi:hypothetical protein